jgi:hypothetical protein
MNATNQEIIDLFKCYESPFKKIRVGTKTGDGGYIITTPENIKYDAFLSAGISNNDDFEEEFLTIFPEIKDDMFLFDAQIDALPTKLKDLSNFWQKKNIGITTDNIFFDIKEFTSKYKNIFFKCDIESTEWKIFNYLSEEEINKFAQITIEFHHLNEIISDNSIFPIYDVLKKINKSHYMVHAHGNNAWHSNDKPNNTFNISGIDIPKILEATYLRKDFFGVKPPDLNSQHFPSDLDKPCRSLIDLNLNYYPFVTK